MRISYQWMFDTCLLILLLLHHGLLLHELLHHQLLLLFPLLILLICLLKGSCDFMHTWLAVRLGAHVHIHPILLLILG